MNKIIKVDRESIKTLINKRYVKESTDNTGDLFIYNYTNQVIYDNAYTEEILQYRGIITDKEGNIVARPFPKFFNLQEYDGDLPLEDFEVFDKLDGSLGILYFDISHPFYEGGHPYIATRGSFASGQAQVATTMLYSTYKDSIPLLNKAYTYLFEIIYPENRIVVNYGDESSLTLLAVIDTASGDELPLNTFAHLGFPLVKRYDGLKERKFYDLLLLNESNKEGFVIRYENGLRIKIKFQDYVKLHSIITGMTSKKIWEVLKEGRSFIEFVDNIPDELFQWIKDKEAEFKTRYEEIETEAKRDLYGIIGKYILGSIEHFIKRGEQNILPRKEIATAILKCSNPHVLFAILDDKDYSKIIWKILEPEHEIPHICDKD